ncbi:MAG: sigma-E factor negative regulatory protein [Pseudomonadota bacterium]|nr:MAG: sigma-E factor negative regulatory protein [Pseudomonadota bacterium]
MSNKLSEQLSALVDGELAEQEYELLLARLENDPELRARWARYNMISDALRNHLPDRLAPSLATRVGASLGGEPAPASAAAIGASSGRFGKQLAGGALAAAVAVVAIIGVQQQVGDSDSGAQTAELAAPSPKLEQVESAVAEVPADRELVRRARFNRYLVNHNEYSAAGGMQGLLPYTRIVSSPAQE